MATSSISTKVDTNLENLGIALHCPIEYLPLIKAVTLYPCMHKINETAALILYGTMTGEICSKPAQPCSICRVVVKGYHVDHTMRQMVSQIMLLVDLESMTLKLQKKPMEIEKKEKEEKKELAYPGKAAKFVRQSGDWSLKDSGGMGSIYRYMRYKSVVSDSLLSEFELLGYKDGTIRVFIKYLEKCEKIVADYLISFGMVPSFSDLRTNTYMTETIEETKKLFKIVTKNNEIPLEDIQKITKIMSEHI